MLFGDKNIFAIECEVTRKYRALATVYEFPTAGSGPVPVQRDCKSLYAKSVIYINGHTVGYWDSEEIIGVLVGGLTAIAESKPIDQNCKLRTASEKELKKAFSDTSTYPETGLRDGNHAENFDDFQLAYFKDGSVITFIWRLTRNFKDYPNVQRGVFFGIVPEDFFMRTVREFEQFFHDEYASIC
jgi:hypothetical protein